MRLYHIRVRGIDRPIAWELQAAKDEARRIAWSSKSKVKVIGREGKVVAVFDGDSA